VPDKSITAELRAEMDAMKGKPFEPEQADRLEARLRAVFPDYDVSRRTIKGDQTGLVTIDFVLTRSESSRWLQFEPNKSHAFYHTDQGWGAFFDMPIGSNNVRVSPLVAWDTTEDLIEEISAWACALKRASWGRIASAPASSGRGTNQAGAVQPSRPRP
jgi:hypothetical protein